MTDARGIRTRRRFENVVCMVATARTSRKQMKRSCIYGISGFDFAHGGRLVTVANWTVLQELSRIPTGKKWASSYIVKTNDVENW